MSLKKKIKIELNSVPLFSYDEICKNKVVKQGPTDHNTALKTEKERNVNGTHWIFEVKRKNLRSKLLCKSFFVVFVAD